jgi:hypothetical protein
MVAGDTTQTFLVAVSAAIGAVVSTVAILVNGAFERRSTRAVAALEREAREQETRLEREARDQLAVKQLLIKEAGRLAFNDFPKNIRQERYSGQPH